MQMHQAEVRPQFTALLDLDRKYIDVSDTFCHLLGRSRNDLIGRKSDEVTAPNSVDIQAVHDAFL